jgi:hypothetical protein
MPLCDRAPYPGKAIVVAIAEGTARSTGSCPAGDSFRSARQVSTAIADVATTGISGSGVFDAANLCLLGITSRKISIVQGSLRLGSPITGHRQVFCASASDQRSHADAAY